MRITRHIVISFGFASSCMDANVKGPEGPPVSEATTETSTTTQSTVTDSTATEAATDSGPTSSSTNTSSTASSDTTVASSGMPDPCGNGVIDGEEQCDNGINNDAPYHEGGKPAEGVCAKDCAAVGYCGDDNLNGREECDDGMDLNVTGPYAPSSTACTDACLHVTEWCGDTTVNGPELCDDGNNADDDGCTSDCSMIEERRVFVTSETYPSDFKTNDNPMGVEGLALADYRCNTLAKALPGARS